MITPVDPGAVGTSSLGGLVGQLAELRDAFDRSFADPPRQRVIEVDDLLAIRVGACRYALRLAQTAGLYPDRPITPLPGPLSALLGVAGFRGSIVPVYDLGAVLGRPSAAVPRWLALTAGVPPVALAFEGLDGHLRVPGDRIVEESVGHGPRGCLLGMVSLPDGARPIVDVPAVRAAIQDLTGTRT